MTRRLTLLRRLRRNERGNAIIEFALTAPLFFLILLGIFDFCWQLYAQQVLQGAVSKAGRDATLENFASNQSALDTRVRKQVKLVFKDADVTFQRRAFDSFDKVKIEPRYDDLNENGVPDAGDCIEDGGRDGNGGADDVVLYTATMRFNRVLPVWKMLGQSQATKLTSSTVSKTR